VVEYTIGLQGWLNLDKLSVGIVGFGKMGVLHGALVNATNLGRVVAIVDREPRITKALRKLLRDVKIVESVDELGGIDVLFVTTPIPTHYQVIRESLGLGIRGIFVEKTLTDSYGQGRLWKCPQGLRMVSVIKKGSYPRLRG
jgi:predicted dehydrogenase